MSWAEFNARQCEDAAHPTCVCACGGRYHGLKHPVAWVKNETLKQKLKAQKFTPQPELDLA